MKESIDFIKNYVIEDDYVVCATSGGVDSMTLLYLLTIIRKSININIICAHINHNLREESKEEFEFVKDYCAKNNIIFEGKIFEKNISGNLESEFRKRRYKFFDRVVNKYNAKYLFTAHHGDDLIETILMRMVRGSSIDGYSGFEKVTKRNNYYILRPLIFYTKQDIYSFAQEKGIEYREDKTNESDNYTRNRYRKYILPKLKDENKLVHKKFIKFSEELDGASKFINKYVDNLLNKYYSNNVLDITYLINEEDYILKKVIYSVLYKVYKENINEINDQNITSIMKIIRSKKPNLSIDLKNNIIAVKKYNNLEIKNKIEEKDYKIKLDSTIKTRFGNISIIPSSNLTNNYICYLNSNEIKLPLYIRNRKQGDFIEVLGLNGKKKVKDIFIDEKINKEDRNSYPILVDSNDTILWIPGIKKSKYDRLKTGKYDIIVWCTKEENNE